MPYRSYKIRLEDGTTRRRTSRHVRFSSEPRIIHYEHISDESKNTLDTPQLGLGDNNNSEQPSYLGLPPAQMQQGLLKLDLVVSSVN